MQVKKETKKIAGHKKTRNLGQSMYVKKKNIW